MELASFRPDPSRWTVPLITGLPGGGAALTHHAGYSILLMRTPTGGEEEA